MTVSSKPTCGAKKRGESGGQCARPAGWGTDHPGTGRCKLHGGATPVGHGMRSTVHTTRLSDLIEKHLKNPDPLNLLPELAQLRAFAEDLLNRWDEIYGPDGALLAWHESFMLRRDSEGNEFEVAQKPRQLPDFSAVSTVVDRVGAMVDRIQKHKAGGAITLETLHRVLRQHGVEVVAAIGEFGLKEEEANRLIDLIEKRWGRIQVDA
jgi:hypothetical protein